MREISATHSSLSLLLVPREEGCVQQLPLPRSPEVLAAMRRHPARGRAFFPEPGRTSACPVCFGAGWVRAVRELPLETRCPACEGAAVR
jgi:hypothetical protein